MIAILSSVRIHIHWTRIRPKISIQIQKTPESGSGSKLFFNTNWNKLTFFYLFLRFSHQKKSIERYTGTSNVLKSKTILWWFKIKFFLKPLDPDSDQEDQEHWF